MTSPQLNELVASLRARLTEIDAELATFDTLQHERSRVAAALDALETSSASDAAQPPKPARRSSRSKSRTAARRGGTQSKVLAFLGEHPGSSASAIAGSLGLKRNSTSTRLTQMAKAGLIVKSEGRGYELPSSQQQPAGDVVSDTPG